MKTEVILKRPFMGSEIRQKSKSELFSATDLSKIGNKKRRELNLSPFNLSQYFKLKSTKEFIEELQKNNDTVITTGRGKSAGTWVHPLLFIDIALNINPKFKVEVYQWLFDELLKYRNNSGESYKKMNGALYERSNKINFHKKVTKLANDIKKECEVKNWETASESQLKLRDKMHENIYLLCNVLNDPDEAIRLGIMNAKDEFKTDLK